MKGVAGVSVKNNVASASAAMRGEKACGRRRPWEKLLQACLPDTQEVQERKRLRRTLGSSLLSVAITILSSSLFFVVF